MSFLNHGLLYYALPAAVLGAVLFVALEYLRTVSVQASVGDWHLLAPTSQKVSRLRYFAKAICAALAAACLVFALAQPVLESGSRSIQQGTVSVVAVVDVSRSMAAMDYDGKVPPSAVARRLIDDGRPVAAEEAGTRLEMVRHVMLTYLLPTLDSNQLGIVSYAGEAFAQAFLTRDTNALRWVVERGLTVSSAPGEGSDMSKALELALAMLDADAPADQEKVIVLFSDGGNDADKKLMADLTQELRDRQVKLVVVAMGNAMPAKIPLSKLAADDDYVVSLKAHGKKFYEVNGQIEKTAMDAQVLQNLASAAGGAFVHLQNVSDLNLLDFVGKTATVKVPGTQQLYPWLLMAALFFLVLAFASTEQWRRKTS